MDIVKAGKIPLPPPQPKTSEAPSAAKKQPSDPSVAGYTKTQAALQTFLDGALPLSLSMGPGVAESVFGKAPPDPKKMSDDALANGIVGMTKAMTATPGRVSQKDLALYKSMTLVAAERQASLLTSKVPVSKMDNKQVFASLVAFDLAVAGGRALTPDEKARRSELEATWKERTTHDEKKAMKGELHELVKARADLVTKRILHCAAAAAGGASLITHNSASALVATGFVITHAVQHGHYGEAALEGTLAIAARIPALHLAAEGISTGINFTQCVGAWTDLARTEAKIKFVKEKLAEMEKK